MTVTSLVLMSLFFTNKSIRASMEFVREKCTVGLTSCLLTDLFLIVVNAKNPDLLHKLLKNGPVF